MPPFEFYTKIIFKDGHEQRIGHWNKHFAFQCKTDLLRWAFQLFDGECKEIIVVDKNGNYIG